MIAAHVKLIESFAELLESIAVKHLPSVKALPLDILLARWNFTATQQSQLRDLARRWALLRPEHRWPTGEIFLCTSSHEAIEYLKSELERTPIKLQGSTTE
jgi:hypothetical protein